MWELELRRLKHDRRELYTRAVQPLLWLGVFGPIMGTIRAIPTGGIPTPRSSPELFSSHPPPLSPSSCGLIPVWERESGILKNS